MEQLKDENQELKQQLESMQSDLEEASNQRPGTSGMSSALRQQVAALQVGDGICLNLQLDSWLGQATCSMRQPIRCSQRHSTPCHTSCHALLLLLAV